MSVTDPCLRCIPPSMNIGELVRRIPLLGPSFKKPLRTWFKHHHSFVDSIHHQEHLTFHAIPAWAYHRDGVVIHRSSSVKGKQASAYKLLYVPDFGVLYARKSNHWGTFGSGLRDYDTGLQPKYHHWELTDGKRRRDGSYPQTSQAGVLWLSSIDVTAVVHGA